ncbi:MAG: glycosyltransferase family 4 protein [Planctomycetota bacterium]
MRVAINALLLSGAYSGVEKAILELLRHIGEGTDDEMVALVGSDFDASPLDGCPIAVQRLPVSNRSRLARIAYEQAWLRRHLGDADLLHAPGYVAPVRLPVPMVVTVYDLIALRHPRLAKRSNWVHYRLRLPRAARAARLIIVPSEAVAADVSQHLGIPRSRVRVVPLGVADRFRPPAPEAVAALRERHGLAEPFVLFVGNVEPKKNLPTLIRAFAAVHREGRPHRLVLAGARGWKCREVYALPASLGIEDAVRFLGYVPEAELPALYGAAEAFVFPSLVEGFGLPPLEAMACGTPVVTSDAGALVETAGDAALRVPAHDVEALADALRRVLDDPALRETMIDEGRRTAARFTWSRTAELTRAVYHEALEAR